MKKSHVVIFLFLLPVFAFSQGRIMLVGGGSEEEGGWSDAPYRWAVENSVNHKVAVISYSDEDNWIPDYFVSLGATEAKNIKIDSREKAGLQSTYDELMDYDVFFFKGGDQSLYYNYFKNTKTQQAIIDKFNAGGVITGTSAGMAILSGVIFTAINDSVYPDEALQDFNHEAITLADDFLPFLPGFIVDSHFTERGRVGRLLAFMAHWYINHDELLTGIGVDDRTALCIDPDNVAKVYGTGSVSFYSAASFTNDGDKPVSDSVHVSQLLHDHSINLNTLEIISGPDKVVYPRPASETGNYEVILSGSENLGTNTAFMNYFVQDAGSPDDHIIVVTAPGKAKSFTAKLSQLGAEYDIVETSESFNSADKIDVRNAIRVSRKVLFVENDDDKLFDFLEEGATGELLKSHIRRNEIVTGFIGEDSRYAGKSFVVNHLSDPYAAYYGELVFRKGLGLLQTSVIMSNTFDAGSADFYENTTASVPFQMVTDSAKYGIYLNRNSYLKFYHDSGKNFFSAFGNFPALIMVNEGTATALAAQPVNASGDLRQYVGFNSLHYSLLSSENTFVVGIAEMSDDETYVPESPTVGTTTEFNRSSLIFFPNPSRNGIFQLAVVEPKPEKFNITVSDVAGKIVLRKEILRSNNYILDISSLPQGLYVAAFMNGADKVIMKLARQ